MFATSAYDSHGNVVTVRLADLSSVKIRRYPKVKAEYNPFDPLWEPCLPQQWGKRRARESCIGAPELLRADSTPAVLTGTKEADMLLLLLGIATPIYLAIVWPIHRRKKRVAWHTHVFAVAVGLSIASNAADPPVPNDHLYGLVIGVGVGLVWTVLYLAILGLGKLFRRY